MNTRATTYACVCEKGTHSEHCEAVVGHFIADYSSLVYSSQEKEQ
jgi:hypothetical protein